MKLSKAFAVTNGNRYEVHQKTDEDGRQRELTTAGPFKTEHEAQLAAEQINRQLTGGRQ